MGIESGQHNKSSKFGKKSYFIIRKYKSVQFPPVPKLWSCYEAYKFVTIFRLLNSDFCITSSDSLPIVQIWKSFPYSISC